MTGLCYLCINLHVTIWIVSGDKTFSVDEFTHVDTSLWDAGFIPHCRRGWCMTLKIGCVTISTNRPTLTTTESQSQTNN